MNRSGGLVACGLWEMLKRAAGGSQPKGKKTRRDNRDKMDQHQQHMRALIACSPRGHDHPTKALHARFLSLCWLVILAPSLFFHQETEMFNAGSPGSTVQRKRPARHDQALDACRKERLPYRHMDVSSPQFYATFCTPVAKTPQPMGLTMQIIPAQLTPNDTRKQVRSAHNIPFQRPLHAHT